MSFAGALAAPPSNEPPRTVQAAVAIEFLSRLESGRYTTAHALLDEAIQRRISAIRLRALRPPGLKNALNRRKVTYEGLLDRVFVPGASPARRYYIVCMSDTPIKGSGSVGYVAVTLASGHREQNWRVTDFRFQSDIPGICG